MNVNTHVCGPTLVLASSNTGLMPVLRRELGPLRGVRMAFIPTASTVEPYGCLSGSCAYDSRSLDYECRWWIPNVCPPLKYVRDCSPATSSMWVAATHSI